MQAKIFRCLFLVLLLLNPGLFGLLAQEKLESQPPAHPLIIHTRLQNYTVGEELRIEASAKEEVVWMRFCFRAEGFDNFQIRIMDESPGNSYSHVLDTSQLVRTTFEYYLSAKSKDKIYFFPEGAPREVFKVTGQTQESPPEKEKQISEQKKEKFKLPFSVSLNGNVQARISQEQANEGEETFLGDGNIRLAKFYQKGNLRANFEMNSAYTSHPLEGNGNLSLSHLTLSVTNKNHLVRMGDLSLNSSPLTAFGQGRRGAEYQFDNQKFSFHLFDISSQQVEGWEGLIPKSSLSLFGGDLGYSFFNQKFNLKAIYVAGKDDPARGKNVGSSFLERRKGNVWALVQELKLFDNRLLINGEFAQSKSDRDLGDEEGSRTDHAWNIRGNLTYGVLTFRGSYKFMGKDFNPIGYQYFVNDRKEVEAFSEIAYKKIWINLSYRDGRDNTDNDPNRFTSYNKYGEATVNWIVYNWVSLNLGYRRNKQETFQGLHKETLFGDNSTADYRLGLNFLFRSGAALNFSVSHSELASKSNPAQDNESLVVNLGSWLRLGNVFSLLPSFSLSTSRNELTNLKTNTFNSFINAELSLIPRIFSISTASAFSQTEVGREKIDNLYLSGYLNLYLGWIREKLARNFFSLRGELRKTKSASYEDKSMSIYLLLNFSF